MKFIAISFLLLPIAAFGLSPMPNYTALNEKADIYVEGHLSGKELSKIKVSSDYDSATGEGRDQFYIMTELVVDGRIQFNGHVIAPDGYLQINGKEKEYYRVFARDGVHLNKENTEETKAWFISRSALPAIDSIFCLGTYKIDYAERNISKYMFEALGSQASSENFKKKKEYAHGGDIMLNSDHIKSIGVTFTDQAERVTVATTIPAESILYQIRKNPNSEPVEAGKPEISSLCLYIDGHLIAKDCFIYTDSQGPRNAQLGFRTEDAPKILRRLSELLKN